MSLAARPTRSAGSGRSATEDLEAILTTTTSLDTLYRVIPNLVSIAVNEEVQIKRFSPDGATFLASLSSNAAFQLRHPDLELLLIENLCRTGKIINDFWQCDGFYERLLWELESGGLLRNLTPSSRVGMGLMPATSAILEAFTNLVAERLFNLGKLPLMLGAVVESPEELAAVRFRLLAAAARALIRGRCR
jgi:hypothetical protein